MTKQQKNAEIAFQIKCISPAFNYGAEKRPEASVLRATSLRGLWRFWARAVIAGVLSEPEPNYVRILENSLFGGTDPPFKAFRMRVKPIPITCGRAEYFVLPHKLQGNQKAISPGCSVEIALILNQGLESYKKSLKPDQAAKVPIWDTTAKKALLAVIWLWSNLGGIGIRSRRGFGSTVLLPDSPGNDPFLWAELPENRSEFTDSEAVKKHLKAGILQSFILIKAWIDSWGYSTELKKKRSPSPDMFILGSLDQVFISTDIRDQLGAEPSAPDGLLKTISDKPDVAEETGYSTTTERLSSPMIVRIHTIINGGQSKYVPVLTWSPRSNLTINRANGNGPWLKRLGFVTSLVGKSIYA
jgi:CRISPR type III-B/RAMP module RAMP protein Cmr1